MARPAPVHLWRPFAVPLPVLARFRSFERQFAVALLVLTAILVGFKWSRMVATPAEWISGEGWNVYELRAVLDGYPLYGDPSATPHIIMNYTPLFVLAQVPLAIIFGAQLWIGRALVVASVLGCAAIIYAAARSRGARPPVATLAAGFFLFHPITIGWGAMARVDYPSLLFGLLALLVLDRQHIGPRQAALVGGLVVLSALTKQTSAVLLVPVVVVAVMRRDPRLVVPIGLGLAGSGLAALGVCLALGPTWLWWHLASGSAFNYSLDELVKKWELFLLVSPGLVLLAVAAARSRLDHWVAFGCVSLLSALAVVIVNGGVNYFMPGIAALAVVSSTAQSSWWARIVASCQLCIGLAAAMGMVLADGAFVARISQSHDAIVALARTVHGPAIIDYGLAADPARDQYVFIYEYTQRAQGGTLPPGFLADRLYAREFEVVALESVDGLPPQATDALERSYFNVGHAGQLDVYRPRP